MCLPIVLLMFEKESPLYLNKNKTGPSEAVGQWKHQEDGGSHAILCEECQAVDPRRIP